MAKVEAMPLRPNGVVTVKNSAPGIVWVRPIIGGVQETFSKNHLLFIGINNFVVTAMKTVIEIIGLRIMHSKDQIFHLS